MLTQFRVIELSVVFGMVLLSGCSPRGPTEMGSALMEKPADSLVTEIDSGVPGTFAESTKWNSPALCPEGAFLTAFTRYQGDDSGASKSGGTLFGRSCIRMIGLPSDAGRAPASAGSPSGGSLTEVPHGPFVWWNARGEIVRSGDFNEGVVVRWESKSKD